MKLTNGEIFNAEEPLAKLMEADPPFEISYGLALLASKLVDQLGVIGKVRQGLVNTYGEKDERGRIKTKKNQLGKDILDMSPENEKKFTSEIGELMNKEVEIVFDVVEIPSTVELKVKPTVLMALLKFIKMVKK